MDPHFRDQKEYFFYRIMKMTKNKDLYLLKYSPRSRRNIISKLKGMYHLLRHGLMNNHSVCKDETIIYL